MKKYSFAGFWYNSFLPTPVDFYRYIKLAVYVSVLAPVGCSIILILVNASVGAIQLLESVFRLMSIWIALDGKRITEAAMSLLEQESQFQESASK